MHRTGIYLASGASKNTGENGLSQACCQQSSAGQEAQGETGVTDKMLHIGIANISHAVV